jgi:hypothetical protein
MSSGESHCGDGEQQFGGAKTGWGHLVGLRSLGPHLVALANKHGQTGSNNLGFGVCIPRDQDWRDQGSIWTGDVLPKSTSLDCNVRRYRI